MNVESLGRSISTTLGNNNGGQSISELLSEMVKKKDADQNGSLNIDEMGVEESLFSQIDTDGDGSVTAEELQAELEKKIAELGLVSGQMGEAEFSLRVSQLISENDVDEDGSLSLEELGSDQAVFDSLDKNRDGVVSADELRAGREQMMAGNLEEQFSGAGSARGYNAYSQGRTTASYRDQSGASANDMFDAARYAQEYNAGMYRRLDRVV